MLKMRTLLQGAAIAALATTSAYAADLPSRKEPPPIAPAYAPPVFTWTGFYVGINAGAAINDNRYTWSAFLNNNSSGGVGFTGGGQIGYNWQTGPLVLGLETDLNYRGGSSSSNSAFGFTNSKSGYFGTVRGRIGYAIDRLLIYGTGGLAYGNTSYPNNVTGIDAFGTPRALIGLNNNNGTRLGWTAGAGAEYAFNQHWSVKAEYLYVDLGRNSVNYIDLFSGLPTTLNARNSEHIVRAGINYHF